MTKCWFFNETYVNHKIYQIAIRWPVIFDNVYPLEFHHNSSECPYILQGAPLWTSSDSIWFPYILQGASLRCSSGFHQVVSDVLTFYKGIPLGFNRCSYEFLMFYKVYPIEFQQMLMEFLISYIMSTPFRIASAFIGPPYLAQGLLPRISLYFIRCPCILQWYTLECHRML